MSTSQSGAAATYQIGFTPSTSATIEGIIVDFCAGTNSPIIGETCTKPTGFSVGTPTVTFTGGANTGLTASWAATSLQSGQTLEVAYATGTALSNATPVVFTLTTATNTSTLGTFYARILTFTAKTGATGSDSYTSTSIPTSYTDGGGIALSTVNQLVITAKVQEQLTFCIDTNAATSCGSASGTAVALGDSQDVLSTTAPAVSSQGNTNSADQSGNTCAATTCPGAEYIVQTNAASGAAIRMQGCTLYIGGACSGINIASTGTGATSTPGSSQFGMCSYGVTGYLANLTITTAYNQSANCNTVVPDIGNTLVSGASGSATFAFQAATTGTFGDQIGTESAGSQGIAYLIFMANVSATQQAAIYATTLTFIATGTF
jgi:hypothetical protein